MSQLNASGIIEKKVMLSAVQPTNRLTLGNYIGAIQNWVFHQKDYDSLFFVVDLHTITVRQDPKILREETYRAVATYIAAGLDPENALIFVQSHVKEHSELAWILSCFSYMGELNRMTQFKEKTSSKQGQNIAVGLFCYPILMAADILLYHSNLVPVGLDQKQHIELTRDIAIRFNQHYEEEVFTMPEPYIPQVGAKILSLQNPLVKMSKSDPDPNSAIYLNDSDDEILKKFKRAVTDSGAEITYEDEKPGVQNLLTIQSTLQRKPISETVTQFEGKQYGHLKNAVAETVINVVGPLRKKTQELMADRSYLDKILTSGAQRARQRANLTLKKIQERIGLILRME